MRIAGWPARALITGILRALPAPQDAGGDAGEDCVVGKLALHDRPGPDEDAGAELRPGKQDRPEPDVGAVPDLDRLELERAVHDRRPGRRLLVARGEDHRPRGDADVPADPDSPGAVEVAVLADPAPFADDELVPGIALQHRPVADVDVVPEVDVARVEDHDPRLDDDAVAERAELLRLEIAGPVGLPWRRHPLPPSLLGGCDDAVNAGGVARRGSDPFRDDLAARERHVLLAVVGAEARARRDERDDRAGDRCGIGLAAAGVRDRSYLRLPQADQ